MQPLPYTAAAASAINGCSLFDTWLQERVAELELELAQSKAMVSEMTGLLFAIICLVGIVGFNVRGDAVWSKCLGLAAAYAPILCLRTPIVCSSLLDLRGAPS